VGHFDKLHIHLDTIPRPRPLEELELAGGSLRIAAEIGQLDDQPLNGTHGQVEQAGRPGAPVGATPASGHSRSRAPAVRARPGPPRDPGSDADDAPGSVAREPGRPPRTGAGLPPPNCAWAEADAFGSPLLAQPVGQFEHSQPLMDAPAKPRPNLQLHELISHHRPPRRQATTHSPARGQSS
jgi:hypothetical protein